MVDRFSGRDAPRRSARGGGRAVVWAVGVAALALVFGLAATAPGRQAAVARTGGRPQTDGLGIAPGKIKHVWLIILENKSYDATFTGLNKNTYLWKTLPAEGMLLKKYFGTGHSSFDNYLSLVSGQATQPDSQADCPYYKYFDGHVDMKGSLGSNPNYGQATSARGPYGTVGTNGCVYPRDVMTLFNQLDAAHISWKGYAQDLGAGAPGFRHDAGVQYCGAPYASPALPGPNEGHNQPNPGSANAADQYLPKHFPFPWFASLLPSPRLQSPDCNAKHIASLFDPNHGLTHDLKAASTTPAFSWISPNMCSDGHDAVCSGDNLSGEVQDKCGATPGTQRNWTGGLYAADKFLERVVPEIECSPAYKDGGLIDITFDEAFPPFTYTHNSFANSTRVPADAATSIANDSAGETLVKDGQHVAVHYEPPGPNTPLATDAAGRFTYLFPGPGNNTYLDRPSSCTKQPPAKWPPSPGTCLLGAGKNPPVARDESATALAGSSKIVDKSIGVIDRGRSVTDASPTAGQCHAIPGNAFVGRVTNKFVSAKASKSNGGFVDTGSFRLVDQQGRRLKTLRAVKCGITLGPRTASSCATPTLARSATCDPVYDDVHATTGGGDTGSVLISPYITPNTKSRVFYNHYSWLRTMEDLFGVAHACGRAVCRGLDGQGHLGYAAQPGLVPFGPDVFTNSRGRPQRAARSPMPRPLQAGAGHPALAIEGDTVTARLAHGRALATVVGPRTPGISVATPGATVPCSFTVSVTAVSAPIVVADTEFTVVDEYGLVHPLRITGVNHSSITRRVAPGETAKLSLATRLPRGAGSVAWAPTGATPLVTWDFEVEIN